MKLLLHCLLAVLASCTTPVARAAVYQWSAPVGGDNRRMQLWIPENCQRIRGLIWCADNLTESNIVESPAFRKVCEEERIGIIRSIPDYSRHKEGLRPALSAAWGWGDGLSVEDKKEYDRCEQGLRKPDHEVSKEEKAAMRETFRKLRMSLQDRCEGELNTILKKMAEVSGYPVKVIVSAYQPGRLKEPLVQNAKEVTREFSICQSPRQLQEITQAAETARQAEIAREKMNVTLGAAKGTIVGGKDARLDSAAGTIGWWSDEQTAVTWTADIPADCGYQVVLEYALADDGDGTEVAIGIGKETVHATLKATGSWGNYQAVQVGRIPPGKVANVPVSLKCAKKAGSFIMNLRGLKLITSPAEEPQPENAP